MRGCKQPNGCNHLALYSHGCLYQLFTFSNMLLKNSALFQALGHGATFADIHLKLATKPAFSRKNKVMVKERACWSGEGYL